MKFKIGDTIKVTIGRDKGKTGKIEKVFPQSSEVIVGGVNLYKKHVKAKNNRPGEAVQVAFPLAFGKIALICPKCNQPTRVGFNQPPDGKKVRVCRKCEGLI